MWVFLSDAFLSVVAHRDRPGYMMVRARVKGDIERVFPRVKVTKTPKADYLFRAEISAARVAKAISDQVMRIHYDNFKDSVVESERHAACSQIWTIMSDWQRQRA